MSKKDSNADEFVKINGIPQMIVPGNLQSGIAVIFLKDVHVGRFNFKRNQIITTELVQDDLILSPAEIDAIELPSEENQAEYQKVLLKKFILLQIIKKGCQVYKASN